MVKSGTNKVKKKSSSHLGDYSLTLSLFPKLDTLFLQFQKTSFKRLSSRKRFEKINEALLKLIVDTPPPCFLLAAVVDYISRVNNDKLIPESYHISDFEFWLNHFSKLSTQENYQIRAKIAGKYVPREDYQSLFPIGMNKVFAGSHFVTAHLSPDIDTTIASFWGWLDAFAARVGTGQHMWSLPGGPPESPITTLFREIFGQDAFSTLIRSSPTLTLAAADLINRENFIKKGASTSINTLDHGYNEKAVTLIDEEGHYLGDWRSADAEMVRQILILFKSCLRWFENNLLTNLISLFAKKDLSIGDIPLFLSKTFDLPIEKSEPARDFSVQQKKLLHEFFLKILKVPKGNKSTFQDLTLALYKLGVHDLSHFFTEVQTLSSSSLFDKKGNLRENRPEIFHQLKKIIDHLNVAIYHIRNYVERLDVVMNIKNTVLEYSSTYLTMRSDVEDIRIKIKNYEYLTVVVPQENGKLFPIGVVWASDLRKPVLGTVSFRDFCNQEEVKMASYLSVISVVDHHKSSLTTTSPPLAIIGDAQSCNVLVAEQCLKMNVPYSLGGLSKETADQTSTNLRLQQRFLARRVAALNVKKGYFIHPDREFAEGLCFLHAILDDTDLLTKVSNRDVECVANLLNNLKSIQMKKDVEIISLEDIDKDQNFARVSAKRILQNPEMYSLYQKSYEYREQEVEANLKLCSEGQYSNIFLDTKEQNGCCRIGQTKMFSSNFPTFLQQAARLHLFWVNEALKIYQDRPDVDLHLQMISTIPNAQEVFNGTIGHYRHKDELWFWVPPAQTAYDHLAIFLSTFKSAPEVVNNNLEVEFLSDNLHEVEQIFARNFLPIPTKRRGKDEPQIPIAILRYKAGSINSRKSMISPYLPRLIT